MIEFAEKLNVAVIEDEQKLNEHCCEIIRAHSDGFNVRPFFSGEQFLSKGYSADIIFLDIGLPGMDGVEVAKRLREKSSNAAAIIFFTAYDTKMPEAFDVHAFHYLVKPVDDVKLLKVLDEAAGACMRFYEKAGKSVIVAAKGKSVRLFLKDIIYADYYSKRITIHMVSGELTIYENMDGFAEILGLGFFRPNRSAAVNLAYVAAYDERSLTLTDGTTVDISRRLHKDFVKALLEYHKGEL